jgi:hypothetical protein
MTVGCRKLPNCDIEALSQALPKLHLLLAP